MEKTLNSKLETLKPPVRHFRAAPVKLVRVINREDKSVKIIAMNRAMRRRLGIKNH